jgi:hypothetical protein
MRASAIESCRTAALGGHVARCEDCAHTAIAYNSCRNRHCPKCQGAAAREWMAARAAELRIWAVLPQSGADRFRVAERRWHAGGCATPHTRTHCLAGWPSNLLLSMHRLAAASAGGGR